MTERPPRCCCWRPSHQRRRGRAPARRPMRTHASQATPMTWATVGACVREFGCGSSCGDGLASMRECSGRWVCTCRLPDACRNRSACMLQSMLTLMRLRPSTLNSPPTDFAGPPPAALTLLRQKRPQRCLLLRSPRQRQTLLRRTHWSWHPSARYRCHLRPMSGFCRQERQKQQAWCPRCFSFCAP